MSEPVEDFYESEGFGTVAGIIAANEARREPWDDHYRLWMRILGAHK